MTRFIGLGSVGNAAKAKSLHALALVPAAEMDVATLTQRPEGTTPCPYELPSTSKRPLPGADEDLGKQVRPLGLAHHPCVTKDTCKATGETLGACHARSSSSTTPWEVSEGTSRPLCFLRTH